MKLSVIGGGSTYTPELIDGIGRRKEVLPFTEIWLCDPDAERVEILRDFASRQLKALGSPASVHATQSVPQAVEGAAFVVSQIRVGGQAARRRDAEMGLSLGLVGQETTGCGGFACALRHIPASVEILRRMEKHCPAAALMNFTNPAGMVTEALHAAGKIRVVGICNVPWVMRKDISDFFSVPLESVELEYFGLNHLSWVTRVRVNGSDRTREVLENCRRVHPERYNFPDHLIEAIGALPSPYLRYYYMTPEVIGEMKRAPKSRAEEVMEIESFLLRRYSDPSLTEKPPELMKRGGIYYGEVAASAMAVLASPEPRREIVNLPNKEVFSWLPEGAVMEYPWKLSKDGYASAQEVEVPEAMRALMIQVKTYEQLTIQAALTGDGRAAYQALLVNPLVGSASKAKSILDALSIKPGKRFAVATE